MSLKACCGLILFLFVATVTAKSHVITLTNENFDDMVAASDEFWIVEFYAPWCGHCKKLAPEWEKVAENLQGLVKVGKVDGDAEKALSTRYQVVSYPSIKMFPKKATLNPYTKKLNKVGMEFSGPRNAKVISKAALANIPSDEITKVSIDNERIFLKEKGINKVLLFSNKDAPPPLYRSLSLQFKNRLRLGVVHDSEKELLNKYEVTEFPTLMVLSEDEETPTIHSGSMKHPSVYAFLKRFALEQKKPSPDDLDIKDITSLTIDSFKEKVLDTEHLWLVEFYDGDAHVPNFDQAASKLRGMAHVGAVNVKDNTEWAAKYGVKKAPALVLFPYGTARDKSDPDVYTGEAIAQAIADFAIEALPSLVDNITPQTADMWLSGKDIPVKILSLVEQEETTPLMKAMSVNFKGKLAFAEMVNPPQPFLDRLNVKGSLPQLFALFVDESSKTEEDAEGRSSFRIAQFPGPFDFDSLTHFMAQFVPADTEQTEDTESGPVKQATNEAKFEKLCTSKGGLCVVGMLDGDQARLDKRDEELASLTNVRAKMKNTPYSFTWVDAKCQSAWADVFDIQLIKTPTVVVMSPRKLRYAAMVGNFEEQQIREFLDGVLHGRIPTTPFPQMPALEEVDCVKWHDSNRAVEIEAVEDEDADAVLKEMLEQARKEREAQEQEEYNSRKKKKKNKKKKKMSSDDE